MSVNYTLLYSEIALIESNRSFQSPINKKNPGKQQTLKMSVVKISICIKSSSNHPLILFYNSHKEKLKWSDIWRINVQAQGEKHNFILKTLLTGKICLNVLKTQWKATDSKTEHATFHSSSFLNKFSFCKFIDVSVISNTAN